MASDNVGLPPPRNGKTVSLQEKIPSHCEELLTCTDKELLPSAPDKTFRFTGSYAGINVVN